jgi:hypothetical protein
MRTMARPYDTSPVVAKPHDHATRCYDIARTMASLYTILLTKSYSHATKFYNLALMITKSYKVYVKCDTIELSRSIGCPSFCKNNEKRSVES